MERAALRFESGTGGDSRSASESPTQKLRSLPINLPTDLDAGLFWRGLVRGAYLEPRPDEGLFGSSGGNASDDLGDGGPNHDVRQREGG